MKRFLTAITVALALVACASITTSLKPTAGVVKLVAAALPYSATFNWNANPATENVTSYQVKLDGSTTTVLPSACTGTPSICTTQLLLTSRGAHVASVAGVNLTLSGDPGVTGVPQVGLPSTLNMVLNIDPTAPTGATAK